MENAVQMKVEQFFSQYTTLQFKKDAMIINSTDTPTTIYYIKSGLVKQTAITQDGEEIMIHIFKPYSFFPIMLTLSNIENNYSFQAAVDTTVIGAPIQQVINFLKTEPDVLFDLTIRLSKGIMGLLKKIETQTYQKTEIKLISLLIYLANHLGKEENRKISIQLPLTHADIASWIGVERETVSRQLDKLQKRDLISMKNHIVIINDLLALQSALNER